MLDDCRAAALKLYEDLTVDERFVPAFPPDLDIVVWAINRDTPSASSESARAFFSKSAANNMHLALAELPAEYFWPRCEGMNVTVLRSVLMKTVSANFLTQP